MHVLPVLDSTSYKYIRTSRYLVQVRGTSTQYYVHSTSCTVPTRRPGIRSVSLRREEDLNSMDERRGCVLNGHSNFRKQKVALTSSTFLPHFDTFSACRLTDNSPQLFSCRQNSPTQLFKLKLNISLLDPALAVYGSLIHGNRDRDC